jgi:acetyl esterase
MEDTPRSTALYSDRDRDLLEKAHREVFKVTGNTELSAFIFGLDDPAPTPRPAFAFFFGSMWDKPALSQFVPHCLHFATRGALAVVFDYRLAQRDGTSPLESIADAKSALRWLRLNAAELQIDQDKVVAAGASGGAHIAACTALCQGLDDETDDTSIPAAPNALILFSPILDISRHGVGNHLFPDSRTAKVANPIGNIRKGAPPAILFHGTNDRIVPFRSTSEFARRYRRKKNACQLVDFEGQDHSFFNFNVNADLYEACINSADDFLVEHGILAPASAD